MSSFEIDAERSMEIVDAENSDQAKLVTNIIWHDVIKT